MRLGLPHAFRPARLYLFIAVLTLVIPTALLVAPKAQADTPSVVVPISLAPTQRDTPIELVALTLDAAFEEIGGHLLITGTSTFKLHNTDRLNDLQASVGFPSWAGDPYLFDPTRLNVFSVSVEGTRVRSLTPARAELKIGNTVRTVDWYTFTVSLAGDEKKTVQLDFQQDLGDSALPRFVYGLTPATNWKGSIGSARLAVRFPNQTTLEQVVAYDPPNPEFDGQTVTWRFTGKEPAANPSITFLRPSVWDDLSAKRRAVLQNPNDANTHAGLGSLFQQLASTDSARRDSFSMQAVAELEAAVRLDPGLRAARRALGGAYESRAGPATGPRNVAYVQLAVAQWEALQNESTARRQLAEDYFYLGLEALTRRAFADAANYYDRASALAPNGAGPLYTTGRLNAERRALNTAWARALLEQDDTLNAAAKARTALGDAFIASFTPPPFYVSRAQVTTTSRSRETAFTLAPLGSSSQVQNAASGIVTSLRNAGTEANLALDGSNIVLQVRVPFENRSGLEANLGAAAQVFPNRAEWALVRTILARASFEWDEKDELLTHTAHYREQVDLAPACSLFNAQLSVIQRNLLPLESAPSNDETQLKRALLTFARQGWQNALSFGRVNYRAGAEEARVDACATKTLEWTSSTLRPERVAVAVVLVEIVGLGILLVRWRRRRSKAGEQTELE